MHIINNTSCCGDGTSDNLYSRGRCKRREQIWRHISDYMEITGLETCNSGRNLRNNFECNLFVSRFSSSVVFVSLENQMLCIGKIHNFIGTGSDRLELPFLIILSIESFSADDRI